MKDRDTVPDPRPPEIHQNFVARFPELSEAWTRLGRAGDNGPLDAKAVRLIKLGVAIGAMRQGAVHAGVRKALAMGITRKEIEQVIAIASGTVGMPSTVAAYSWIQDSLDK